MGLLYNLARMTTATTGTGTITLGSAASGFLTFAQAGVSNGEVVTYAISDGSASEIGTGTYTSSGTTLTRTVLKSTNSNAAINLSGSAQVMITAAAEDIANKTVSATQTFSGPISVGTSNAMTAGTIELGHASDTTLSRSSAGNMAIEGNVVYRAGGTDVPVADGGTGVSSLTAYAVICGGTTTTGAVQSIAGLGSSGQVLTSNGAGALPTFQAATGGGWTLLNTLTASSSATLSDTTSITSTYDAYAFVIENLLPATNTVTPYIRVTTDGGSTWAAGTAYTLMHAATASAIETTDVATLGVATVANTGGGICGVCYMTNPNSTTKARGFIGHANAYDSSSATTQFWSGVYATTGSAINGVRFMFSSGNIASGKVRIYGIKTS